MKKFYFTSQEQKDEYHTGLGYFDVILYEIVDNEPKSIASFDFIENPVQSIDTYLKENRTDIKEYEVIQL